jgi:hypothetical protein
MLSQAGYKVQPLSAFLDKPPIDGRPGLTASIGTPPEKLVGRVFNSRTARPPPEGERRSQEAQDKRAAIA